MKTRITSKVIAIVTAVLMVFVMMPQFGAGKAFAEDTNAPGGVVASNSASDAIAAFGADNVSATYADHTLTITVNGNIYLAAPVVFKQGSAGDTVVLNVGGSEIVGAKGSTGSTEYEDFAGAKGKDAIQIVPGEFNVEISGGSVLGGEGAVCKDEYNYRYGADGGNAVSFIAGENGTYWYPNNGNHKLEYGLKLTGDAYVQGGDGADIYGEDWTNNIRQCGNFKLKAGKGGAGIGQADTGIPNGATTLAYTKIEIIQGRVFGGEGGSVDIGTEGTPILNHYNFMNDPVIKAYIQQELNDPARDYDTDVANQIKFVPGDGGDGMMIGAGRKYVYVADGQTVQGASCGLLKLGKSQWVSEIGNEEAASGNGISVYGDIGLTDEEVDTSIYLDEYNDRDCDPMGIYIGGTVKGGDSNIARNRGECAGNGGCGIMVMGKEEYTASLAFPTTEEKNKWGIVEIGVNGNVIGGKGGDAYFDSAGSGGTGIKEAYSKSDQPLAGVSDIGTDYYIIHGTAEGGNGGDSYGHISGPGMPGSGGNGFCAGENRRNAHITGSGLAKGGNGGRAVDREGTGLSENVADGVRIWETDYNTVNVSTENGNGAQAISVDNTGLSVTTSMSAFADYPSTDTQLSCTINKPEGFMGDYHIKWTAELITNTGSSWICDIETPGTDIENFHMLSDEDYKYLMYEGSYFNGYSMRILTTGRIYDVFTKSNNSTCKIWCDVQLDDGRWATSEPMVFTKDGWNGGDNPTPDDTEQQIEAALAVKALIESLYDKDVSEISLHDRAVIEGARAEYEALIAAGNEYVQLYVDEIVLQKLINAENRIIWLEEIDAAVEQIVDLLDSIKATQDDGEMTPEDIAEARADALTEIQAARAAYDELDAEQKEQIEFYAEMLEAAEALMAIEDNDNYQTALEEFISNFDTVSLEDADVSADNVKYNGLNQFPKVTVKVGERELTEDVDFSAEYLDNIAVGTATINITGKGRYTGETSCTFEIEKGDNTLDVKAKTATVKYKKLKKKTQYLAITKAVTFNDPGQGTLTYKKLTGSKKIKISSTTGKITVKKKLKKKTYKVKVKITASGDDNYNAVSQTVTFKIKVK